jgi:hypothetical protein
LHKDAAVAKVTLVAKWFNDGNRDGDNAVSVLASAARDLASPESEVPPS